MDEIKSALKEEGFIVGHSLGPIGIPDWLENNRKRILNEAVPKINLKK